MVLAPNPHYSGGS